MYVFLLLDGCALIVGGVEQFVAELVDHAFFAASTGVSDQPADCERSPPVGIHFDGHLVVRATHAPGFHFQQRLGVFHRLFEQLQRFVAALGLQLCERFIEDALGGRLLALPHHRVHKLGHQIRSIHRVRIHSALCNMSFTGH